MKAASTAIGQSEDWHQCGTEVKEKRDADEADDDGFENQIALERVDGLVDQP